MTEATERNDPGTARDRQRSRWMAAAQDGDQAAYAALLGDCVPLVQAIARRQGVPPSLIDDVVQDVLLTLHRVRHTYDPARPFGAWLRAIAQRRSIDLLRRQGRRGAWEVHAPEAYAAAPDSAEAPSAGAERASEARILGAAIAALPERQREAVEHLALAEQSLDEAAAATGRSTGALKVNLHRALKTLRARFGEKAGDDV